MSYGKSNTLIIGNKNEAYYLNLNEVLYIEADGNYCNVYLVDGDVLNALTSQLGEVARMIHGIGGMVAGVFAQIGRRYVVNTRYILRVYPAKQILMLSQNDSNTGKKIVLHPSVKALQQFRKGMDVGVDELAKFSRENARRHDVGMMATGGFRAYQENVDALGRLPSEMLDLLDCGLQGEMTDDDCRFLGL